MKIECLPLAATLVFAVAAAMAQTDAPAPSAGASAPRAAKPGPRALTPAELRESASSPADDRPEGAVTPQLSIPFGKSAAAPLKPDSRAQRRGAAASSGGIDDSAARCEAQSDAEVRAACRAKLTRAVRTR